MEHFELVVMWVGLLAGVSGIVISVVAIVFAYLVNRRSTEVNDQTIRSLQKIESEAERISEDTRGLIKAAWDKLLGTVGTRSFEAVDETSIKAVASGIATELRAELGLGATDQGGAAPLGDKADRLERVIQTLESTLVAQLRASRASSQPIELDQMVFKVLGNLSETSQALVRALIPSHLTSKQYKQLQQGALGQYLQELRDYGLLVPVTGLSPEGREIPCYYIHPDFVEPLRSALPLLPEVPDQISSQVMEELERVGYQADSSRAVQ